MTERIWDRFLTEQDRASDSVRILKRKGFGESPALVLVDLYRSVFGDKPEPLLESIKTWPSSCGLAGWNSLPHIQKLLKIARDAKIPIVHVTGLPSSDGVKSMWTGRKSKGEIEASPRSESEKDRRGGEIIDEVKPLLGEAIVRRVAASGFMETGLVGHLNWYGIDTIIVCGETTSGCVRATVVDGFTYSYRVIVPEETVFDRTESSHALNLYDMNQKYADVIPLAEVVEFLERRQIGVVD